MDLTVRDHALDAARPPLIVAPDAPLRLVARRLWEAAVGAALVADTSDILGVISERDVVTQLGHGADPDQVTARQAMTRVIVSARPDDSLLDIALLMIDSAIRHIPVIDEWGEIAGVVSIRDLLRPLLIDTLGGTPPAPARTAAQ